MGAVGGSETTAGGVRERMLSGGLYLLMGVIPRGGNAEQKARGCARGGVKHSQRAGNRW